MSERRFSVQWSPLTDSIYAGRLSESGTEWVSKSEATTDACVAVAEHVVARHGGAMTLRAPDGSGWDIEVTVIVPE